MSTADRAALSAAADALGVALNDPQLDQLLGYMDWLAKWNKVYNLTALRDRHEMLTHHLIDSLSVVPALQRHLASRGTAPAPATVLDVGSGGGLPGVVLAIALPEAVRVTCVDTVAKKAAFVQQVAAALRLPHLKGLHSRVEHITTPFDVVTSRAFASLADFTTWSRTALGPNGVWMAMKGKHPGTELTALESSHPDITAFHVEPLTVPGLDAQRCVVWMRPSVAFTD
jgi:16S rRNA (guanine527-N7)-methyltransferase